MRKVKNRPSKEELWNMLGTSSFEEIGRKYELTGGAIKKWCKSYNLPYRRKDINSILNKETPCSKHEAVCLNCNKKYISARKQRLFCSLSSYKEYIKKHGLINKDKRKKSVYYIYNVNEDKKVIQKRVTVEEIDGYIEKGWKRGRILQKKH